MRVELTKDDFDSILSHYALGKYRSHKYIFTGGNTVYKLSTIKGDYILKIYGTANEGSMRFEMRLSKFLEGTRVPIPKMMRTKSGKRLLSWGHKWLAIQEFVLGKPCVHPDEVLAKDMGKQWGLLHKNLKMFSDKFRDKKWVNHQFKELRWEKYSPFGLPLRDDIAKLYRGVKSLDRRMLTRGFIHGDLCEGNFLVYKNKVSAIIDFDDTHEDYLVQEIAVTIAHNFITRKRVNKRLMLAFLREYSKFIVLNTEEKRALYYFIKIRQLNGALWCYEQIRNNRHKKGELWNWAKVLLDKYASFSKWSLDDWLVLVG